ncbi:C6 transcription factor [Colletotrichum karsti]|uniref:C6 transcription factor n=1 Tax=Colletotrichum karsti TaxID=1095194 RepID=A0A9P6LFE0_9PEZI|nr:C6 transcription factor [Colletotrichum karsti]KAF9870227.1 C6 transcription factor [Colletotrichum karsti]
MRYSAYMEQCVRELEDAKELESDMHVIYMVRIQRLAERISQIRGNEDWDDGVGVPKAPISAYASSFQAELDKLEAQMPRSLQKNRQYRVWFILMVIANKLPDFLRVQMATARLRLYEPPTIDADLLESLSKSLASLSSGHNSALNVFYQANAALKAWFETWLAIPVPAFYPCPLPMASQLMFAVVMMSRWAWLAASNDTPPSKRTVRDPSTGDPNVALAVMEAAINPNTPVSASTPSTNARGTPSWDAETSSDMKLPQVLAELKTQLSRQPELMIDVADILNRVAEQLEEVDAAMAAVSVDSGPWRGNIWTLGATKVRIAQIRQKRWSDTISKGYEESEEGDEEDEAEEDQQAGFGEVQMQDNLAGNVPMADNWYFDSGWGPTFYDVVDPSLFVDGMAGPSGDWASAALEGMAPPPPMDQLGVPQAPGHKYV